MYQGTGPKKGFGRYTPGGGKALSVRPLTPLLSRRLKMKNTLRAALAVLVLVGTYAGLSTSAPAMTHPHQAITVADGGAPVPTTPTYPTPTSPTNPKGGTSTL